MNYTKGEAREAPDLRWLRRLVIVLTVTMIVGFILIVVLFVIRFQEFGRHESLPIPSRIVLPDGTEPIAYTRGPNWYAVVTSENRILIYDHSTGDLINEVEIEN